MRASRRGWPQAGSLAAIVLVILAIVAAAAAWFFLRQSSSPEAVINKYLDGVQAGNADTVRSTLSADALRKFNTPTGQSDFNQMKLHDFQVTNRIIALKTQAGSTAVYGVKFTIRTTDRGKPSTEETTQDVTLIKEAGHWKISESGFGER